MKMQLFGGWGGGGVEGGGFYEIEARYYANMSVSQVLPAATTRASERANDVMSLGSHFDLFVEGCSRSTSVVCSLKRS